MNKPLDLLHLLRPIQWIKNAFVFVGILFSLRFKEIPLLIDVCLTAIAFSLVSSSAYILNDIMDRENDKLHEKKKTRPIPAGKVTIPAAISLSTLCLVIGMTIGYFVSANVFFILAIYVTLNIAYSLYLKNIVIIDVFCIAAGFMLRILAGTLGVDIPPSNWLLLCGLMITLFLGFSKRRAEIIALPENNADHRKVLSNYSPKLLDQLTAICATGVILSYSLYTMNPETMQLHKTPNLIYTVPFVIYALFRYLFILYHDNLGGDPSKDLITDKHIIVSVIGWAIFTLIL